MENPVVANALKYGLYGGVIMVIYSLITMLIGFSPSNMVMMGMLSMLVMVIVYCATIYLVLKNVRSYQGHLSLGQSMLAGLIAALIMGLLTGAFNFVYHNFVDPGYLTEMQNIMAEFFEENGLGEEMIEAQLDNLENQRSISAILLNTLTSGVIGLVISLVAGLIMKREEDSLEVLDHNAGR